MCKPIENVKVDNAVITARVAHYLGCLQANNNEDLYMMLDNVFLLAYKDMMLMQMNYWDTLVMCNT